MLIIKYFVFTEVMPANFNTAAINDDLFQGIILYIEGYIKLH